MISQEPAWAKARLLSQFAELAALAAAAIGALVLAGWLFSSEVLLRVRPHFQAMNPVTAVALVACGVALYRCARRHKGSGRRDVVVVGLAVLVILLGVTRLAEWMFGWQFGFESLLFRGGVVDESATGPNNIAPNTALNFVLCGLALLLFDVEDEHHFRPAQALVLVVAMISLLALMGYSYHVLSLYQLHGAPPMAVHTAVAFLVFSGGLLAARPSSGFMTVVTSRSYGGAVARRLLPVAILMPWVLGGLLLSGEDHGWIERQTTVSIFAITSIVILTCTIWWTAKLLHEADLERARTDEALRQATANLERSNADLQQFASVASHDLQEPLRMVTSYGQLLSQRMKGKLDPESRQYLSSALEAAERMRGLISDLLAYSRLESRAKPPQPTESEAALHDALANLALVIQETGAVVEHDPLPKLKADPSQLTQLFQNLLGNALKFRSQAPPRIQVRVNREGPDWLFSISDNGIGIDPKFFDRIFVIFQRLHTRREYSGSGIGLAVCKKIVERHGGRIWLESTPGQGSTFFFTIPAMEP